MRKPIMNIKNPRVKSILITILEILIVAGIIFGVLMFIYSKVNKEADKKSGITNEKERTVSQNATKYVLSVSKKNNVAVIYKYTSDISKKEFKDSFKVSVGKKAEVGYYKPKKTYSWMKTNGSWHQYNTQYVKNGYLQSVSYKNKYPNTMKRASYKALGVEKHKDKCIYMTCDRANWIRKNAYRITVQIIKDNEQLKSSGKSLPGLAKACGWDPSDPNKDNPYKKTKNSAIVFGSETVYVEKGSKVNYLDNVIAKDAKGNVITTSLKHSKVDTSNVASNKVQYAYKKNGLKLKETQTIKVVDTTPPIVTIANRKFVFKLRSLDKKDVIKQSNIDKIKNMVRSAVSCNEPGCVMNVQTIDKEDLNEGDISVVVTAKDASGNVGAAQTFVKVKVKEEKIKKFNFPKKKKTKKKKVVKKHKKKKQKQTEKQEETIETETVIEDN